MADALAFARKLGIRHKTIDLTEVYDSLLCLLPTAGKLAQNNLKPRLRMLALYYFANKMNYLVCGTGNKSEISLGYFTKFGDGAVDLLPIAGLLKRQVVGLAEELGIPRQVIDKQPTAGLWPGQTDEGEMGITYAELDDILARMARGSSQAAAPEKVRKVKQMICRSEHKRQRPRICVVK